jgi:hypothetical protein
MVFTNSDELMGCNGSLHIGNELKNKSLGQKGLSKEYVIDFLELRSNGQTGLLLSITVLPSQELLTVSQLPVQLSVEISRVI